MPDLEIRPGALTGKVALVTGASKRLGRCYALALARAGARVVACARTMGTESDGIGTLAELAATGRAQGLEIAVRACDLMDDDQLPALVDWTVATFGGIDALINNAVAPMARLADPVARDIWDAQMQLAARAPYVLAMAAAPHMEARGGGSVVNLTSLAGSPVAKDSGAHEGLAHYAVAKGALNRLTTWLAEELRERGIAVNALSPGDANRYMRLVNGWADLSDDQPIQGEQLDEGFWGDPIVFLAGVRPAELTGELCHTYNFGRRWGPVADPPRVLSPALAKLLGKDPG